MANLNSLGYTVRLPIVGVISFTSPRYTITIDIMDKLLLPPNDSLADLIKSQINEVDDHKVDHNVNLFEKWIDCQSHLPKNYEKQMLKTYLRGTKHDLEVAKRKFELYFAFQVIVPNLWHFEPFSEDEWKVLKNCIIAPMPHLTEEGYRLIIGGIRDSNLDLFDMNLFLKNAWKMGHLIACNEKLVAGQAYLFDAANITAAHITKIFTPDLKNAFYHLQEGFASRIRQIYIVNAPVYFDKIISVFKMLFKEKLRNRIFVERGITSVKIMINEKSLPKDYGGIGEPSYDVFLKWMQYIENNQSWFSEQEKIKLIGPVPKNLTSNYVTDYDFGIQGSFRQLAID